MSMFCSHPGKRKEKRKLERKWKLASYPSTGRIEKDGRWMIHWFILAHGSCSAGTQRKRVGWERGSSSTDEQMWSLGMYSSYIIVLAIYFFLSSSDCICQLLSIPVGEYRQPEKGNHYENEFGNLMVWVTMEYFKMRVEKIIFKYLKSYYAMSFLRAELELMGRNCISADP